MSIIVAVTKNDRTVMAADSLTCFGDSQRVPASNIVTDKIRRIGDAVMGSAGWALYDSILRDYLHDRDAPELDDERQIFAFFLELWKVMHERYTLVNDQAQSKESPFGDLDSSFLIANRGGIFKVSTDLDVSRFKEYFAIGSGSEYALGALQALYDGDDDAETLARRAVESAATFDVYCGGDTATLGVEHRASGPSVRTRRVSRPAAPRNPGS